MTVLDHNHELETGHNGDIPPQRKSKHNKKLFAIGGGAALAATAVTALIASSGNHSKSSAEPKAPKAPAISSNPNQQAQQSSSPVETATSTAEAALQTDPMALARTALAGIYNYNPDQVWSLTDPDSLQKRTTQQGFRDFVQTLKTAHTFDDTSIGNVTVESVTPGLSLPDPDQELASMLDHKKTETVTFYDSVGNGYDDRLVVTQNQAGAWELAYVSVAQRNAP